MGFHPEILMALKRRCFRTTISFETSLKKVFLWRGSLRHKKDAALLPYLPRCVRLTVSPLQPLLRLWIAKAIHLKMSQDQNQAALPARAGTREIPKCFPCGLQQIENLPCVNIPRNSPFLGAFQEMRMRAA